ncbi:pirin family protein [Spirosoma koreense]
MDTQIQAQIYLADQRGCSQTPSVRSYHSFNFGAYQQDSRMPFGSLQLLNDDTLRAGASLSLQVAEHTHVLLLPVNGGLEYQFGNPAGPSHTGFVEPGQAGLLTLSAGMYYTISNPYETEHIDLLQGWLTSSMGASGSDLVITDIDLSQKNTLLPLFELAETSPARRGYIGQFAGRQEGAFLLESASQGIYVFVIQGAFEVADRLLHERDGLSLRQVQDGRVEFEALSNEAVLILLTV